MELCTTSNTNRLVVLVVCALFCLTSDVEAEESQGSDDAGHRIHSEERQRFRQQSTEAGRVLRKVRSHAHQRRREELESVYQPLIKRAIQREEAARNRALAAIETAIRDSATSPTDRQELLLRAIASDCHAPGLTVVGRWRQGSHLQGGFEIGITLDHHSCHGRRLRESKPLQQALRPEYRRLSRARLGYGKR